MLRKLLPVLLSVAAFLGGAAGGEMLRRPPAETRAAEAAHGENTPAPEEAESGKDHAESFASAEKGPEADPTAAPVGHGGGTGSHGSSPGGHGGAGEAPAVAWFAFPQQFLVPILHDGRLDSTMILSLSLEMPGAARETVYAHEIKLRDALLRQLLIHANTGGFDGNFTSEAHLRKLRADLTVAAQGAVPEITDVLIGDIGRQER